MSTPRDWMEKSKRELAAAQNLGQAGFYAEACFWCQQSVEKALKALLLLQRSGFPKSHSLRELADAAGIFGEIKEYISDIELDYAATRYLDVSGVPTDTFYDAKAFQKRLAAAKTATEMIEKWMKNSKR